MVFKACATWLQMPTAQGESYDHIYFRTGSGSQPSSNSGKTRVDQVMPLLPALVEREGVIITPD